MAVQRDMELPEGTDMVIEEIGEPDNIGALTTDRASSDDA